MLKTPKVCILWLVGQIEAGKLGSKRVVGWFVWQVLQSLPWYKLRVWEPPLDLIKEPATDNNNVNSLQLNGQIIFLYKVGSIIYDQMIKSSHATGWVKGGTGKCKGGWGLCFSLMRCFAWLYILAIERHDHSNHSKLSWQIGGKWQGITSSSDFLDLVYYTNIYKEGDHVLL